MIKVFEAVGTRNEKKIRHYNPSNIQFVGFDWNEAHVYVNILEEPEMVNQ